MFSIMASAREQTLYTEGPRVNSTLSRQQSILDGQTSPVESGHNGGDLARPVGVCYTYAKILDRFWYVICLLVFMTVAAFSALSFTLYELPDFTDPTKGFQSRDTIIASRVSSHLNLLQDSEDLLIGRPPVVEGIELIARPPAIGNVPPCFKAVANTSKSPFAQGVQFCHSVSCWGDWVLDLVFMAAEGDNILTSKAIKSLCKAEGRFVTSHPAYLDHCLCLGNYTDRVCPDTWSLGNHIALLSNRTSCEDIEDDDVKRTVELLELCAPFLYNVPRLELESTELPGSFPAECSQHDFAIHTILYYLLPTEFSRDILDGKTPLKSPTAAMLFPISDVEKIALETIFLENIATQPSTDGITRLIAVDATFKDGVFPNVLYADTLILGIAACVIVFLIWTYTGSLRVTIASLLNMVFSLILAYFVYTVVFVRPFFPFGNIMAVILIIAIGADDTFVYMDLWKKCKSDVGDRDLPRLVYESFRHAAVTMSVTSFTTAAALYAALVSKIIVVRCFAVFAGTAVLMNLALTLTLLPAVIVLQHKSIFLRPERLYRAPKWIYDRLKCLTKPLRVCYDELIPWLVLKLRYIWIVAFLSLMAAGAIVVFYFPRFQLPASSDFQFYVDSHYFEQYDFVYKEQFSYNQQNVTSFVVGCIVWGVRATDNGDHWVPNDYGPLALDDNFTFGSPDEQKWLLNLCRDIRDQSFFKSDLPHGCFIDDFITLMRQETCVHPLTMEDISPCCNQPQFPYDPALFETCVIKFSTQGILPNVYIRRSSSEIAAIEIFFSTSFPRSYNYQTNDELWITLNTWFQEKMQSAPGSLQRGWFVPGSFEILFYDLQYSLASGTIASMLITLAVASGILLLSIQNIWLTVWSMVTITAAVFVTLASLILLGWRLNIVEATIITLAVGLSVDYTIHYSVAYKLSPISTDRRQRTLYSLRTLAPAITIAALTTFLAGALVLPSTVLVYYQFGEFLTVVIAISWAHGTFFFQSLCMVFGPQKSCGDIPCLPCTDCCRSRVQPTERGPETGHSNKLFSKNGGNGNNISRHGEIHIISD